MKDFFMNSIYFGIFLTLISYALGIVISKKTKFFLFSPLIVSIVLCIAFLVAAKIPYESYAAGANFIACLLTPATVCLAIPLYEQVEKLKENWLAVLCGILCGVVVNLVLIFLFCRHVFLSPLYLLDQYLFYSFFTDYFCFLRFCTYTIYCSIKKPDFQ